MKVKLVVGQGPHKGKEIPVSTAAKFIVGRSSDCHLRPASQAISKRHCALEVRDGKCYVEDLNSTNGTFVNEEPLKGEREVQDGDMLKIGPLDFVVRLVDAAAPAATPKPETPNSRPPAAPPNAATSKPETPSPKPAPAQAEVPTQVDKQTKKSATPYRPAAQTPANLDDDTIGSMLLDLDEGAKVEPGLTEPSVPEGSTIMDLLIPQKENGGTPAPYRPKDANKQATPASTSKAAQDILEKYRRRPRS